MAASRSGDSRSLLTNRDFNILWLVQTLSMLGDAFAMVAVPLLVLQETGSVVQMGLLTAIATVGAVVSGPFCGVVADRVDRRKLMILCDLARVVLYGAIPLCWLVGPQMWLLYVVMALASVFDLLFQVGYVTLVPNLVGRSQVVAANGRLESTYAIAFIVGPALAGVVSGLFGAAVAIGVDAASFALSAIGLAFVRYRHAVVTKGVATADSAGKPGWSQFRHEFVEGARYLWNQPVLRAVTVALSAITFLTLGVTDIFIFYVQAGLGQDDHVVGYLLGLASVGSIVAGTIAAATRRRLGFGVCWLGSYVMCGIAVGAIGFTTSLPLVTALAIVFTFGTTLAGVCSMSLRQEITPDHLLGRVTSSFWTIHNALGPIGAAVLTASVGHFGVRGPLFVVGLAFLVVVGLALATPARLRDPAGRSCSPPIGLNGLGDALHPETP